MWLRVVIIVVIVVMMVMVIIMVMVMVMVIVMVVVMVMVIVMVMVVVMVMVMVVIIIIVVFFLSMMIFNGINPRRRSRHLVKVEGVGVQQLVKIHIAVVTLNDLCLGLQGTDDLTDAS